jgi:hypothetical protein
VGAALDAAIDEVLDGMSDEQCADTSQTYL